MANGANRLFDVIKQTGESTNGISSQVVSLTIKSVNPLILMRDDRLEIPAEFCILHKSLNIDTFRINDIVTAIVLNNGQQYFILYNNTAEEQGTNYNDLSNKPKINGVELKGNKSASDLELDNYSNLNNKPKINGIELNGNKTSDDLLIVSKSELQQIVQDMTTNINNKVTKSGDAMTGELDMQNNSLRFGTSGNIFWKEDGFGDKFRILPYFSGSGSDNKLVIQSTNGDAGTDPQNWKDLVYIHADTGLIELAGRLLFNNKDSYDAIRKTRTLNGTDYQLTVGVGGNGSARMEYVSNNNNVLGSIEVRSNGLYNGVTGNKLIESKNIIDYQSWQSVVLTRSDTNYFYIVLYGSNILKEGTYSIANDFRVLTYGTTNSDLTIPKSAISSISRRDWGFELIINRSGISGIASTQYNGIAIVATTIRLQST